MFTDQIPLMCYCYHKIPGIFSQYWYFYYEEITLNTVLYFVSFRDWVVMSCKALSGCIVKQALLCFTSPLIIQIVTV